MTLLGSSHDEVVPLAGVPDQSPGSPLPLVVADDVRLLLAYLVPEGGLDPFDTNEQYGIVEFQSPYVHAFGPPSDETLHAHPLASRGLGRYGAYEVRRSSWVRRLEEFNRVHRRHDPKRFESLRHFVFTFHDNLFECVAKELRSTIWAGQREELIPYLGQRLLS